MKSKKINWKVLENKKNGIRFLGIQSENETDLRVHKILGEFEEKENAENFLQEYNKQKILEGELIAIEIDNNGKNIEIEKSIQMNRKNIRRFFREKVIREKRNIRVAIYKNNSFFSNWLYTYRGNK